MSADTLDSYDLDMDLENEGGEFGSDYEDDEPVFDDIDFEALGIDPASPTMARPGSEEKVIMLAARYAAGVPLWHDQDCYDHGPSESALRLFRRPKA